MNPVKAEGLSPELQRALEPLLSAIEELSERICEYNERIEALAQESYPQVALLKQIKGVGTMIALTFLLTLEDPHRFRKSSGDCVYRLAHFPLKMEERSTIRWQHRLKPEHPTCTERQQSLNEECGWKGGDSGELGGGKNLVQRKQNRTHLTPTGLLMEGDSAQNSWIGHFE
jgi:hypothetical protein